MPRGLPQAKRNDTVFKFAELGNERRQIFTFREKAQLIERSFVDQSVRGWRNSAVTRQGCHQWLADSPNSLVDSNQFPIINAHLQLIRPLFSQT
jgi:hypothetical protein